MGTAWLTTRQAPPKLRAPRGNLMQPENTDRKQVHRVRGRFQKGVSGNPRGKPPGARHATTIMAEQLMEGEAEAVVRAVVKAKRGDMRAARLVRGSANGVAAARPPTRQWCRCRA
jgi:hypothetical protein